MDYYGRQSPYSGRSSPHNSLRISRSQPGIPTFMSSPFFPDEFRTSSALASSTIHREPLFSDLPPALYHKYQNSAEYLDRMRGRGSAFSRSSASPTYSYTLPRNGPYSSPSPYTYRSSPPYSYHKTQSPYSTMDSSRYTPSYGLSSNRPSTPVYTFKLNKNPNSVPPTVKHALSPSPRETPTSPLMLHDLGLNRDLTVSPSPLPSRSLMSPSSLSNASYGDQGDRSPSPKFELSIDPPPRPTSASSNLRMSPIPISNPVDLLPQRESHYRVFSPEAHPLERTPSNEQITRESEAITHDLEGRVSRTKDFLAEMDHKLSAMGYKGLVSALPEPIITKTGFTAVTSTSLSPSLPRKKQDATTTFSSEPTSVDIPEVNRTKRETEQMTSSSTRRSGRSKSKERKGSVFEAEIRNEEDLLKAIVESPVTKKERPSSMHRRASQERGEDKISIRSTMDPMIPSKGSFRTPEPTSPSSPVSLDSSSCSNYSDPSSSASSHYTDARTQSGSTDYETTSGKQKVKKEMKGGESESPLLTYWPYILAAFIAVLLAIVLMKGRKSSAAVKAAVKSVKAAAKQPEVVKAAKTASKGTKVTKPVVETVVAKTMKPLKNATDTAKKIKKVDKSMANTTVTVTNTVGKVVEVVKDVVKNVTKVTKEVVKAAKKVTKKELPPC